VTDLGSAFAGTMAHTCSPSWHRLLYRPGATVLSSTLLRPPRCVPLALHVSASTFFGEEMLVVAKADTLDEYCTARALAPDFINIDAATAAPRILRGSSHMLARHRPFIALEVWEDPARDSRRDFRSRP
jgi:hypothetical protein